MIALVVFVALFAVVLPFKNKKIQNVSAASQPNWFRYQGTLDKCSGYIDQVSFWYNGATLVAYVEILRFDDKSNFIFNNTMPVYAYDCRNDKVLDYRLGYYNHDNGAYFTYDNLLCTDNWRELGIVIYNGAGDIYIAGNAFYNYGAGYNDAEGSAYDVGYNAGVDAGYSQGYKTGFGQGESTGFSKGVASANDYSFSSLFGAVIDVPVNAFTSLLNFELLGVNMLGFITGLLTLALIIFIIKLCMGGK